MNMNPHEIFPKSPVQQDFPNFQMIHQVLSFFCISDTNLVKMRC